MNVENIRTAIDFAESWTATPEERRVAEVISVYRETNRLTDPWVSGVDENGIYMPDDGKKIYVRDIIDRSSYLGKIENQVFDSLETWAEENDEGTAIWISPAYPGKYPCSKIIFHQIAYETGSLEKVILNAAVLFDSSPKDCLNLIHQLFPNLKDQITATEQLRQALIIPDENFQIGSLMPIEKPQLAPEELEIRARQVSELIGKGASPSQIAYEMQRQGLLGEHSISCASTSQKLTFSELVTKNSDRYEFKPGTCRICGLSTEVGPCKICRSCEKKL